MEKERTHLEPSIIACQSPMEGLWHMSWFPDSKLQVRWRFAGNANTSQSGLPIPLCSQKNRQDLDRKESLLHCSSGAKIPIATCEPATRE
ncbi:hypothetical protein AVEN_63267-1 [Araneus ventricosus]|uniref:Uncharacterized protein n=1 Tax=Araneus ventricosus TaxID=182803 RepID=A0A4Y2VTA9_ARAVE|nr:hypothetical protein AVEN_232313-1 [Araneus ventricosus]GBO27031.1 hypothetical protein AVEN_63267-1 [Araneus ventricosus]